MGSAKWEEWNMWAFLLEGVWSVEQDENITSNYCIYCSKSVVNASLDTSVNWQKPG